MQHHTHRQVTFGLYQDPRDTAYRTIAPKQAKVRFEDAPADPMSKSIARRALRTLKEATNRRFYSIKSHRKGQAVPVGSIRQSALRGGISSPERLDTNWISDATGTFTAISYRSCMRRSSVRGPLSDARSIMDVSVEHTLIDTLWRPLEPEPFQLNSDLEQLF